MEKIINKISFQSLIFIRNTFIRRPILDIKKCGIILDG